MQKLSNPEIDKIEKKIEGKLPGLYRKLLVEEGFGFSPGQEAELYDPRTIRIRFNELFSKPESLFHPYVPFGRNKKTKKVWVIDAATELVANAPIKDYPYDLAKSRLKWWTYVDWTVEFFDPYFPLP